MTRHLPRLTRARLAVVYEHFEQSLGQNANSDLGLLMRPEADCDRQSLPFSGTVPRGGGGRLLSRSDGGFPFGQTISIPLWKATGI